MVERIDASGSKDTVAIYTPGSWIWATTSDAKESGD